MKKVFTKSIKTLAMLSLILILILSSLSIAFAGPEDDDMPIDRRMGINNEYNIDKSIKDVNCYYTIKCE